MVVAFNRLWLSEEATRPTEGGYGESVASYKGTRGRNECPKGK
jgi:hypothetical protein